jgi:hypothetical protein
MDRLAGTLLLTSLLAAAGAADAAVEPAAQPAAEPAGCVTDGSGFLTARLRGDLDVDLDWREPALTCLGMSRPDGLGIRLRFSGPLADGSTLAIVFAPPVLAEGQDAHGIPVNVTILQEAQGRIYGTRGGDRCTLDEVTQRSQPSVEPGLRLWAVHARGFCTVPARALDDNGSVLLTRFDFRGQVVLGGKLPEVPETAETRP